MTAKKVGCLSAPEILPRKLKGYDVEQKQDLSNPLDRAVDDVPANKPPVVIDQERDRCIIIASDGVWQFMTYEEVANIVFEFYMDGSDAEDASDYIIKQTVKRWKDAE